MVRFIFATTVPAAAVILVLALGVGEGPAAAQGANAAAPAAAAPPAAAPPPAAVPAVAAPAAAAPAAAASTAALASTTKKAPVKRKVVAKKAKPVAPADAPKGKVLVDNQRDATLVQLTLTSTTAPAVGPVVIAKDLVGHDKVIVALPKAGGCVYDVSGSFDDQATVAQAAMDLCSGRALHLTE